MFKKQKSMMIIASLSLMALVAPMGAALGKAPVTVNKAPAQIQVVDDHGRGGREPQPGDDRGRGGRGKSRSGHFIARDGHGEPEPGDDRGRGGRQPEPGDDRGRGGRAFSTLSVNGTLVIDDHGRGGWHPEPGDDRGRGGRNH